jgi:hypothetical protein
VLRCLSQLADNIAASEFRLRQVASALRIIFTGSTVRYGFAGNSPPCREIRHEAGALQLCRPAQQFGSDYLS